MASSDSGTKQRVQTRLPPDEYEKLEQYADNQDLNHAAAVRQLLRAGMNQEGQYTREDIREDLDLIEDGGRKTRSRVDALESKMQTQAQADAIHSTATILGLVFLALAFLGELTPETTIGAGAVVVVLTGVATYLKVRQ